MKKLILVLTFFPTLALAGDPPSPVDITIPITATDVPLLNRGYDSRSQNWRGLCVKGSGEATNENFTGALNLRLESSQDDAAKSLGIQAGGRYRTGVTEVSASAQLAQSTVQTGYSVNFTYKFDSSYVEQYDANSAIDVLPNFNNLLSNQRGFLFSCGDEYVSSVARAARILVNLSVSFSSEEEAKSFAAEFKFNSPTVGVTAAIQQASKRVSKKTTMKFHSVQIGGIPGYSGKAICPDEVKSSSKGNRCTEPIIQCGFGKFDQCIQMLEGIVSYSAHGFSKQVTTDKGEPRNYAVTAVHVQPYLYAGGQFPLPPDETTERAFQEELKVMYGEFERFFDAWVLSHRVTYSGAPRLSARQSEKMIELESRLHKIVNHLTIDIEDCYKNGYAACSSKKAAITDYIRSQMADMKAAIGNEMQNIRTVEEVKGVISTLAQPETFAQYCDLATDNYPAVKTTIESMKKWAVAREATRKEGKDLSTGDECANLENYFKNIADLDLSVDGSSEENYPVSSLAPIAVLSNLRSLTLNGQGLRDISILRSLNNLNRLSLDRNQIEDICTLSGLPNLNNLSVANNKLTSISCLSRTPFLAILDARGNSTRLICPLKSQKDCKVQDFTESVSITQIAQNCGVHVGSKAMALDASRVLVVGGATPANGLQATRSLDVYERDSCSASGTKLHVPRANLTLTATPKGIFVAGGYTSSLEIVDPVTLKSRLLESRLKSPRAFHTATLLQDGRVLIVGGYTDTVTVNLRSKNISASFEIFNPKTETIESTGFLNTPRAEHTATLLANGRVLITGGYQEDSNLTTAEIIDPNRSTATTISGHLNEGRFAHSTVALSDGRVVIAGGIHWQPVPNDNGTVAWKLTGTATIEIFDPVTETFRKISDKLTVARGLIETQNMADGRVLLIGGNETGQLYDPTAALASSEDRDVVLKTSSSVIEVFDPATEGLYLVGSLSRSRSQATVAPLGSSSVLVIGGMGSNLSLLSADLLVYHP